MINGIIFDFDGVICDSVDIKTNAFSEIYSKFGKEIQEKVLEYHLSNMGINRYEKFKFIHKEFFNKILNEDEIQRLSKKFSNIVFNKILSCKYIKGAEDFIMENYRHTSLRIFCYSTSRTH